MKWASYVVMTLVTIVLSIVAAYADDPATLGTVVTDATTALQGNALTVGAGIVGAAALIGGLGWVVAWVFRLLRK